MLIDEFQAEGLLHLEHLVPSIEQQQDETLACFVLVDPEHRHQFCTRYDMGKWPFFFDIKELPPGALEVPNFCAGVGKHVGMSGPG